MNCECREKTGLDLAKCLAPPRGDYELDLELSDNLKLVITSNELIIKQIIIEDDLPFTRTIEKKVSEEFLNHVNLSVEKEKLPCLAAKALVEAAEHGSEEAELKMKRCREIVEELLYSC